MIERIKNWFRKSKSGLNIDESTIKDSKITIRKDDDTIIYNVDCKGMSKKSVSKLIEEYKEEISFDDDNGTIKIDGDTIPYNKEIWLPNPDYSEGSPEIESIKKTHKKK